MSNNISNRQINGSLAGQIALNLDKRDGSADGQISQSVWNEFWDANGAANSKGKKENVGQNGVSVQDAFKFIMTRIFNTAKKQLAGSEDKSWENEENKYNTINDVAKNLYKKAGGEKLKIDNIKANTSQVESENESAENVTNKNQTNLQNAYNKLKELPLPKELENYRIPKDKYITELEREYKNHQGEIPIQETPSADFASSILIEVLKKLVPNMDEKLRIKVAIQQAAALFPEEGQKIGEYETKTLLNDTDAVDKLTQAYIDMEQSNEHEGIVKQATQALSKLKSNIKNIHLPKEVNAKSFAEKLNNYNPQNIQHFFDDSRFSLAKIENPSEADIIATIISDILGISDAKENREITSQITLRKVAIDNTIALYPENTEDMTIRDVTIKEINARAEAYKKAVEEARDIIISNINSTKIGSQFKTEDDKQLFINCLKNVGYDIESTGAGRAEDGVFVIETNNPEVKNKTEMVVLLLHETYHNYSEIKGRHHQKGQKTEEAAAEMFALLGTADIINQNPTINFPEHSRYGHKISEYKTKNDVINNDEFKDWLNGYSKTHSGNASECIEEAKDIILLK